MKPKLFTEAMGKNVFLFPTSPNQPHKNDIKGGQSSPIEPVRIYLAKTKGCKSATFISRFI